ncbi:hypothetical protein Goklo_014147 [Gossypium klotzschianum]|uniref:Uncharacterized protein n=1 Tax=Gossypium klotzschianum TaxID=34286 RepID=A0A7J8U6Q6_9ROSI|nr:hypothetical protein [Gossypium klotzschianum]
MAVIEGNEISNARDTTYERPNPEEAECLDDIEVSLNRQGNLFLPPQAPRSDSASGIYTWTYDQAKIKEVVSHMIMIHEFLLAFAKYELFILFMKSASAHYVRIFRAITKLIVGQVMRLRRKVKRVVKDSG